MIMTLSQANRVFDSTATHETLTIPGDIRFASPGQCLLPQLRVADQPILNVPTKHDRMVYKK